VDWLHEEDEDSQRREERLTPTPGDHGAKIYLSLALGNQVEQVKRDRRQDRGLRGAVASFLRIYAKTTEDPGALDVEIVNYLASAANFDRSEVQQALADLRESGDYDRIVKEARKEG
jgi:hypothetical protein